MLAQADLCLIDMPIGLADGGAGERQCDREARALLGRPRASSVFRPPCRAALAAADQDYAAVCAVNRTETGVGLSRQTFNILSKMREVDTLLRRHRDLRERVRESHPELCLWQMNEQQPMRFNKRSIAGQRERRALLIEHAPDLEPMVERLAAGFLRRDLALDDVVDAAVLACSAHKILRSGGAHSVPAPAPVDRLGLPMAILLPRA
jgi:predicted RNase H-like nuclease